jgi:predicted O-methyltransferase YrrM
MRRILIREKLAEMGVNVEDVILGDFDYIGEFTAKKSRDRSSPLFKSTGCFFRPNYERGILIDSIIKRGKCHNFLEIGFGRGYGALCAAKALYEIGVTEPGSVMTIDPSLNQEHLNMLSQLFPKEWLSLIKLMKGTSYEILPKIEGKCDFIYIDGDHRLEATRSDWNDCREKFEKFLLFDDYFTETDDAAIQCKIVIDSIDDELEGCFEKDLIIQDRRIFLDDRGLKDEEITYGQVLMTRKNVSFLDETKKSDTALWDW